MASSTPKKYDVFLSFRGQDSRNTFVSNLNKDLCRNGIATFMDEEIRAEDDLSPTLLKAIEESKIALVILSKNYAVSSLCLEVLRKILQCNKKLYQKVVPIFYHVDSDDVQRPKGSFKDALENHKTRFGTYKVDRWTFALKRVANFKGWALDKDKPQTELIKEISKDILEKLNGDHNFPEAEPEVFESQLFLLLGGRKLNKPPKVEKWERAKFIDLSDNDLSELPPSPRCPRLEELVLQGNRELRKIPPSFFSNMPALQVLDLSKTSIKDLPQSFSELVNLKWLSLKHCELLRTLPSIVGKLVKLKVLDLKGTQIMRLPEEVKKLTNLTCLKVSFFEPVSRKSEESAKLIPSGIISALHRLEKLKIDVSPDDKRWNACVEAVVSEVCGLASLCSLKIYIPRVELLRHFAPTTFSSLFEFQFTVGKHANRIMCRLPSDAVFERERFRRCLKYINGADVPEDIKLALRRATAFFLDRHATVKTLSKFGFENMKGLECFVLGECNELRVLMDGDQVANLVLLRSLYVYSMKNLRSIWDCNYNSLLRLRSFTLRNCPKLTSIFTLGLLENLVELVVDDCPKITSLMSDNHSEQVTNLERMSLRFLPELTRISNILLKLPKLECISVYDCPKLKSLPIDKASNKYLREIKGEMSWWKALEWKSTEAGSWDDIFVRMDVLDE